jgi:hypothetical protein
LLINNIQRQYPIYWFTPVDLSKGWRCRENAHGGSIVHRRKEQSSWSQRIRESDNHNLAANLRPGPSLPGNRGERYIRDPSGSTTRRICV